MRNAKEIHGNFMGNSSINMQEKKKKKKDNLKGTSLTQISDSTIVVRDFQERK